VPGSRVGGRRSFALSGGGRAIADVGVLVISLLVLGYCGDRFVLGMSRLASVVRVKPAVVGTVVGGLGASIPELIVAGVAAGRGEPGLAVGSMVGSNVVNVGLGLALAALVAPVRVESRTLRREIPVCILGVLLMALAADGGISRTEGVLLGLALIGAIGVLLINAEHAPADDEVEVEVIRTFGGPARSRPASTPPRREIGLALASVIGMVAGAEALVRSATALADRLGMERNLIGLTIVAVGTSVPVVVIAVQAARRGLHDLVAGNVFGSDLFIALGGGSLVALIRGGEAASVGSLPLVCMCLLTLTGWGFMARGNLLNRWEASALIAGFGLTMLLASR
jgi:cation:H+ antiporter